MRYVSARPTYTLSSLGANPTLYAGVDQSLLQSCSMQRNGAQKAEVIDSKTKGRECTPAHCKLMYELTSVVASHPKVSAPPVQPSACCSRRPGRCPCARSRPGWRLASPLNPSESKKRAWCESVCVVGAATTCMAAGASQKTKPQLY